MKEELIPDHCHSIDELNFNSFSVELLMGVISTITNILYDTKTV